MKKIVLMIAIAFGLITTAAIAQNPLNRPRS